MRLKDRLSGDRGLASRPGDERTSGGRVGSYSFPGALRDRPSPDVGFKTSPIRAVAAPTSDDHRHVSDFTESMAAALRQTTINHCGAANSCAEGQKEHVRCPDPGAVPPLGHGGGSRVVDYDDLGPELLRDTARERHIPPAEVRGMNDRSSPWVDLSGDRDPDRDRPIRGFGETGAGAAGQRSDDSTGTIVRVKVPAAVSYDRAVRCDETAHHFGGTEVDPED